MPRALPLFDVDVALRLYMDREDDVLAAVQAVVQKRERITVADLPESMLSLEVCDGLDERQVREVVSRAARKLGHVEDTPLDQDVCVSYYNELVDYVNSYEARLEDPSRNCTPQYTVAGLDMPHCFWINLDRSPDRRANMERLLRGYRQTRIAAVDAKLDGWRDLAKQCGLDRELKATPAERCCTISHLRAFEAIQAAQVDVALVLEDDITFKFIPPDFSFERTWKALPPDWDVLHISARSNPPSKLLNIPYQFCEWRAKLCYSTAAFLINGKHIDSIVDRVKQALLVGNEARADWVIYGSLRTYILTRPVIDEDPFRFNSAIHSENEEYHRKMHVALSELYCNEVRQSLGLPLKQLTYAKGYRGPNAKGAKGDEADGKGAQEGGANAGRDVKVGSGGSGVPQAGGKPDASTGVDARAEAGLIAGSDGGPHINSQGGDMNVVSPASRSPKSEANADAEPAVYIGLEAEAAQVAT